MSLDVARSLADLGDNSGIKVLRRILERQDYPLSNSGVELSYAIEAVKKLNDKDSIPLLINLIDCRLLRRGEEAQKSLEHMTNMSFNSKEEWQRWWVENKDKFK